jgi:uncharacterized membrane protein YuzA (DUF378 family)
MGGLEAHPTRVIYIIVGIAPKFKNTEFYIFPIFTNQK